MFGACRGWSGRRHEIDSSQRAGSTGEHMLLTLRTVQLRVHPNAQVRSEGFGWSQMAVRPGHCLLHGSCQGIYGPDLVPGWVETSLPMGSQESILAANLPSRGSRRSAVRGEEDRTENPGCSASSSSQTTDGGTPSEASRQIHSAAPQTGSPSHAQTYPVQGQYATAATRNSRTICRSN